MKKISVTFITLSICCLITSMVKAQQPLQLMQKALQSVKKHKQIGYTAIWVNKNIFSETDTAVIKSNELIFTDGLGKVIKQNITQNDVKGKPLFLNVFLSDTLYALDLTDSTYTATTKPAKVTSRLNSYIESLQYVIDKKASKISRLKDTLFNKISCYSFFVKSYDTVENNQHNYTHLYFYINKKSLLPVCTIEKASGSASKGGYSLGRVNAFTEASFDNYQFDNLVSDQVLKPNLSGFYAENKTMLSAGSVAPAIVLNDLNGNSIPPELFKNKAILIAFGSTTCAANPLANRVLNRLAKQYNSSNTAVIAIYTDETAKQAKDYIESNHITFPVYMGSSKFKKRYQTISTPNFYVIDKKGKIFKSFEGYYDKLEKDLIAAIEQVQAEK